MFKKDKNKRNFERFNMIQASYCVPMGDFIKSDPIPCWINNISMGGISIDVNMKSKLEINDIITISYTLGDNERSDRVQINHTFNVINNLRCGCVFTNEDKERNNLVGAYIKHVYMTYK
ncbi:MAG: PilZ domain-containing protein [Spirochaetes bacterium]|jgi:hypothetical protein|nr:PilZ domain-containing protein [Spirochaetota bacterium]